MTSRAFQVRIVGDVRDAKRALESMEGRMGRFTSAMKGVGGAMVAAFAVKKVIDFGTEAVKRAEAMQSAYAATAQILDQTGGVVGKTAEEIKQLNRALAFKTGMDKEAITTGSNILLTFKGIRNEVGEGNQVFDRAASIMTDMSAVFKTDLKSSATQLGKALEDPIKGVGALARVGVTFTDQQKAQIKALQESGDLLGAQQIVLGALEGQVGGVAAKTADSTAIIGNAWKEVQESVGNVILPLLATLATFVTETLLPGMQAFFGWVSDAWTAISGLFSSGSSDQIATFTEWAEKIWEIVKGLVEMVRAIIDRYVAIYTWIWEKFGDKIVMVLRGAWGAIKTIIDLIMGVLGGLIDFVTAVFQGRWGDAFDAIKGIVRSFFDFFRDFPGKIVEILAGAVGIVGRAAANVGKAIVNGIIGFWNKLDPKITIGPLPSWLPGIGGKRWQSPDLIPDLPQLAAGGIVTGPTIAMIGEAGPEAVVPLSRAGGLGNTYQITVQAGVGDEVAIGEAIVDAITAFERAGGTGWRTAAATGT